MSRDGDESTLVAQVGRHHRSRGEGKAQGPALASLSARYLDDRETQTRWLEPSMVAGRLSVVAVMLRLDQERWPYTVDAVQRRGVPRQVEAVMFQEGDADLVPSRT